MQRSRVDGDVFSPACPAFKTGSLLEPRAHGFGWLPMSIRDPPAFTKPNFSRGFWEPKKSVMYVRQGLYLERLSIPSNSFKS